MTRARDLADSADKDITGTLTVDGLTVDGVADVNANNINYTGSSPKINIYENDTTDLNTQLIQTGGDFLVRTLSDDASLTDVRIRVDHSTGNISFYEDTGTTPKFHWSASDERLGLGTQLPEALLDVAYNLPDDTNGIIRPLKLRTTDLANQTNLLAGDGVGILFEIPDQSSGSVGASIDAVKEEDADDDISTNLVFRTSANNETLNEALRIDSSGQVGINTASPAAYLHVNSGLSNLAGLFQSADSGATITLIDNSTTGGSAAEHGLNTVGNELEIRATSNLSFETAGTERCRVDATGVSVTSGTLTTPSVTTNEIRGIGNIVSYHADYDASSNSNHAHLFFVNNSDTPRGGFWNDDFYSKDNLSVGRIIQADGTTEYNTDGTSAITVYSSNTTTGPANYKNYTQVISRNSTDPDYGLVMASSAYVESQTPDTGEYDQHAFVIDNGGRMWAWQSYYAGRTRRGDSGTTTNHRVGDHGFTGYSNTGGTQGEGDYNGYTQIVGRETANSDMVFRVSVAGSDRIHFYANGNGYFDGGADLGNADYAEYFEWADGNPDNEDRRGYSVVLTPDGKMRIATSEDDTADFLGIVSVEAAVVGDSAWAAWTGKCERDRFGQKVYEDYELLCWGPYDEESKSYKTQTTRQAMIDAGREADIPEDAITVVKQRQKLAADYDPDREYTPRKDRKEWQAIGLMGKLPLLKGQPTAPQWRKLFDLNDEVEMWLVR